MNYGIFRSQPIMTINDLSQIGSHNKREKKAYKSNPDIKLELTKNNIGLVPLIEKYVKGFKMFVKDYEKERNERMNMYLTFKDICLCIIKALILTLLIGGIISLGFLIII